MIKVDGVEFEPVDASALVSVVRRLAETRGDFVYVPEEGMCRSCKYTHKGGEPCCIIGCGLHELGISIPYDHEWDMGSSVGSVMDDGLIVGGSDEERRFLKLVQSNQDSAEGHTWSASVRRADAGLRAGDDEDDSEADASA